MVHDRKVVQCGTGVFVSAQHFAYDKGKKTPLDENGNALPGEYGKVRVNNHTLPNDISYHKKQAARLDAMTQAIDTALRDATAEEFTRELIADIIAETDKRVAKRSKHVIYDLFDKYIRERAFSVPYTKSLCVLERDIVRYEQYRKMTDEKKGVFVFDINRVTRDDIEDFRDYLRNEHTLAKEEPELFAKLLADIPRSGLAGRNKIERRGENTIVLLIRRLKTFFIWLNKTGHTANLPFAGMEVGSEKYSADPYYITPEERDTIAAYKFGDKQQRLAEQRDIFVFHCLVGCRVGDLMRLTKANICGDMLIYQPHKTKDGSGVQARVPLCDKAQELVAKYDGADEHGRLFPFAAAQHYNEYIKIIMTMAGVTRRVVIRDSKTGEPKSVQINTIASSHMARRTFVGTAYNIVKDPSLIGAMSGHVDGSRAFARYRRIDDDHLRDVIGQFGKHRDEQPQELKDIITKQQAELEAMKQALLTLTTAIGR